MFEAWGRILFRRRRLVLVIAALGVVAAAIWGTGGADNLAKSADNLANSADMILAKSADRPEMILAKSADMSALYGGQPWQRARTKPRSEAVSTGSVPLENMQVENRPDSGGDQRKNLAPKGRGVSNPQLQEPKADDLEQELPVAVMAGGYLQPRRGISVARIRGDPPCFDIQRDHELAKRAGGPAPRRETAAVATAFGKPRFLTASVLRAVGGRREPVSECRA